MVPGPDGLGPDAQFEAVLRDAVPQETFGWRQLSPLLDSSVMDRSNWVQIAHAVRDMARDHDAVVVLHGTDTLAWTAAALSFLLSDLEVPVVITGAMRPLRDGGDGLRNVALALQVARQVPTAQVLVAFGHQVMPGARAVKIHAQDDQAFSAPGARDFDWRALAARSLSGPAGGALAQVDVVQVYPGASGAVLRALSGAQGVVIEAFGSGNMPGAGRDWHAALAELRAGGTEIAVVTQCLMGRVDAATYAAGASVGALGLIACRDMTTPAAATKLGWLLAQGLRGAALADAMRAPVAGEISA